MVQVGANPKESEVFMTGTLHLDDITIDRIIEDEYSFESARVFFPTLTESQLAESRSWMRTFGLDEQDQIVLCFQSYVVRTPHHTILVDTCIGNDKFRPGRRRPLITHTKWMDGLAALGLTLADIDIVMCTHLHVDHVGWNTRLLKGRWVPTFPNARYLFSKKEFDYWKQRNDVTTVPYFEDSVLPIVAAGQHQMVSSTLELNDYVRLMPTPGHTPDHFSVAVGNGRDAAVLTGDLFHSPLQVRYPELSIRSDFDPQLGIQSRRSFLERYCDTDTICCTGHFSSPSRMRVRRSADGFRCDPVND